MPPELTEISDRLEYVAQRHLFAVLTGECGAGKSTILRHQLEEAVAKSEIFTDKAIQKIFEYSTRIPRVIDIVCTMS